MSASQYQLTVTEEGVRGAIRHCSFNEDDRVEVRDLTTRITATIAAGQISPYRHTLFLDGKAYRILNVVRRPN